MARLRSGWHLTPSFKCFEAGRRLARRLHHVRLKAGWHAKVLLKHAVSEATKQAASPGKHVA